MVQSTLGHLQINIDTQNIAFYKDLLIFLGWKVVYEDPTMLGIGDGNISLWFTAPLKELDGDYDGTGMNHIALNVPLQVDVDNATAYLHEHDIQTLFNTPCHRPEFSSAPKTYYQVMFESPDHILFEVVYTGLKS